MISNYLCDWDLQDLRGNSCPCSACLNCMYDRNSCTWWVTELSVNTYSFIHFIVSGNRNGGISPKCNTFCVARIAHDGSLSWTMLHEHFLWPKLYSHLNWPTMQCCLGICLITMVMMAYKHIMGILTTHVYYLMMYEAWSTL